MRHADAGACVLEIARLVPRGLARDHQAALGVQPVRAEPLQPGAGGVGQSLDCGKVGAQIDPNAVEAEVLDRIKSDQPATFNDALDGYRRAMAEARSFVIDRGPATKLIVELGGAATGSPLRTLGEL